MSTNGRSCAMDLCGFTFPPAVLRVLFVEKTSLSVSVAYPTLHLGFPQPQKRTLQETLQEFSLEGEINQKKMK